MFRTTAPDAAEIERARNTIETRIIEGLETLGGFGGVADRLNMYNQYLGTPGLSARRTSSATERYTPPRSRGADDFQRTTHAWSCTPCPAEKDLASAGPTPTPLRSGSRGERSRSRQCRRAVARSSRRRPGPSRSLVLPVPESTKLANGLTLILSRAKGLAGGRGESRHPSPAATRTRSTSPGLANFTAAMLTRARRRAARRKSPIELAQIGARFGQKHDGRNVVEGASLKRNFGRDAGPDGRRGATSRVSGRRSGAAARQPSRAARAAAAKRRCSSPRGHGVGAVSAIVIRTDSPSSARKTSIKAITRDDLWRSGSRTSCRTTPRWWCRATSSMTRAEAAGEKGVQRVDGPERRRGR